MQFRLFISILIVVKTFAQFFEQLLNNAFITLRFEVSTDGRNRNAFEIIVHVFMREDLARCGINKELDLVKRIRKIFFRITRFEISVDKLLGYANSLYRNIEQLAKNKI